MPDLKQYLFIIAVLTLGIFVSILSDETATIPTSAVIIPNASSTLTVINSEPAISTEEVSIPSVPEEIVSSEKTAPPKVASVPEPEQIAPTQPIAESIPVSVTNEQLDDSSSALRNALVNIICYVPAGSGLHSISASGIFIDPKGIILTNAHVAQYFLLSDRNVSCDIRSGSPATDSYDAELIYISPTWIKSNTSVLTTTLPNGTGEYDFALLAVSKSSTKNSLPISFPYAPLAMTPPIVGVPVAIASFGAQFLEASQIRFSLFPIIVFGSVKDVFTFGTNTIDVIELGGSVAAQEGSSGGGIADASGYLVGTITTSTISGSTDTRILRAITSSYIRAEYANETGQPLDLLLAQPTSISISNFEPQIFELESILTANLP